MDITYTDEVTTLVVTRTKQHGADRVIDHFTGMVLSPQVQADGALVIYDGRRAIAAYPSGSWVRVTPETKQQ